MSTRNQSTVTSGSMGDTCGADDPKVCAACGTKESLKMCTGCHLVHYCGRECQLAHRKTHKKMCKEQEKKRKNVQTSIDNGGIKEDELDKPVVVFFVERFVDSLMFPLLGSRDPVMWDVLFKKKGAKERVYAHMISFTMKYLSTHSEYDSPAAVKRLLEADYHQSITQGKDPIFSAMQKELYDYLKEVEHFF